jgi:hypothetical protein
MRGGGPNGRIGTTLVVLLICAGPSWLFLDPLTNYRLQTDDFAYVAGSRTWGRTVANLLVPHNTHVVPAWRVVTYGVMAASGRLAALPDVMAPASYGILVITMLAVGRLVAVETGRTACGLLAMVAAGSTSIMAAAGTWFSASQTLWAVLGILLALGCLQRRSRGGGWPWLLAAIALGWLAAGFWTLGHLAGIAGAAYLSGVPDPKHRRWAWLPLAGSLAGVVTQLVFKGRELETTVRVDGRTPEEAFSLANGAIYTLQAIPENLVFGNLGLTVTTTALQGALLTAALATVWVGSLRRAGRRPSPLERAGLVLIVLSYVAEYGFRGYKPFAELRGVAVPWYNTIPHVGLVLFLSGWWTGGASGRATEPIAPPITRRALGILAIQAALLLTNAPRVQTLWDGNLAPLTVEDMQRIHVNPSYRRARALRMAGEWVDNQRRDLARLDRAERAARERGIGRAAIRQAFGRVTIAELPRQYDATEMLDAPERGTLDDPATVRAELSRWLDPAPRL